MHQHFGVFAKIVFNVNVYCSLAAELSQVTLFDTILAKAYTFVQRVTACEDLTD